MLMIKSSSQTTNPKSEKTHLKGVLIPLDGHKGSIFGLIRFLGKSDHARELISETIEERLHRFKDTLQDDVHIARRFEQLLQALNEDIAHIVSEHRSFPILDAHIVIGVIYENQVYLSGIGNLSALFMHRTAQQRYVLYELSEQFAAKEERSWDKIFSTVLDGELHPGDIFYVATRVSAREITFAELQDILTTLPASGSLKRIQQYLHRDTVYGAICFQISDKPESGPPKKENPMHSMERLDKTKESTAALLGEQAPDVSGFISKLTGPLIKKLSAPGTRGYKSLLKRVTKVVLQLFTILLAGLIKILGLIVKYSIIGLRKLPGIIKRGQEVVKEQPSPKQRIERGIYWFNTLPKVTKYAGLIVIALAIVLLSSLTISARHRSMQEQENTFNTLVSHVEEKMNAAQASLIYDDDTQARQLLQEASTLLATLEPDGRTQKQTLDDLSAQLQDAFNDIEKIAPVDVSVLATLEQGAITHAIRVNDTIYALTGEKQLYRLNALENSWQHIDTSNGALGDIQTLIPTENGNALLIDANQQLGRINLSNGTLNPIVSGTEALLSAEDVIEYNESVYILSAAGEQIIKMRERGDGYEAGTPWISSVDASTNLSKARALAIDGNIYILTDTTVLSFLSGREQTFALQAISPALHDPVDIWTSPDTEYLYILEPSESRILVFDKSGLLIAQYTNNEFNSAKSMIIQEADNSIIIVTDTTAYTFAAQHLLQ